MTVTPGTTHEKFLSGKCQDILHAVQVMVSSRFVIRKVIPVVLFLICIILLSQHLPVDVRGITPDNTANAIEVFEPSVVTRYPQDDQVQYWVNHVARNIRYSGEKDNFVFIKCMKCATQTVGDVLRRYAFTRRLNVLLPRDNNIYLGWPYLMHEMDFRPSEEKFNCLIEHSVYNRTITEPLFPSDTQYITIIREPWSHFKSTFHYFRVDKITDIKAKDPVVEFLKNRKKYDSLYKSHESYPYRYCIPDGFSVTRNLLSHCLGMPLGFPKNRTDISNNEALVNKYIKKLDREFGLVMIMEYFDESMIFLKRLMRLSFKDIVYEIVNVGNYSHDQYPKYIRDIHKMWSSMDYKLYDHFRKKMELEIRNGGPAFQAEIKKFKAILQQVNRFCMSVKRSSRLNAKLDVEDFTFTGYECAFMSEDVNRLDLLQKRNNEELTENLKSYKRTC